ncbi:hypothetical protein OG589_11145 [Sphaerisporangium sp. NBC_01403]|uniref:hypothetical protein n=1 Tax=Sphaerisporangium sp. NBC_01403 TaxID=2903599 RepID=UPI0032491A80
MTSFRKDIARRFPLVARGRPACHPLDVRIRQVGDLADAATKHPDHALRKAAEAHNLAALIASDCGLPSLARLWCWSQFAIFHDAQPFEAATAKLALQPLINLGRLLTRDGNSTAAHHLIETLFNAVQNKVTAQIDDKTTALGNLTRTPEAHRELLQWLWTVLLADGSRALAQAGRWARALQHLQDHHGVGQRLLDGRQIAIIAHHAAGDHRLAAHLLAETSMQTPWEQAVATCLAVLTSNRSTDTMADGFLALDDAPGQVLFRTRLRLTAIDLTDTVSPLAHAIESDVLRSAVAKRRRVGHNLASSSSSGVEVRTLVYASPPDAAATARCGRRILVLRRWNVASDEAALGLSTTDPD